MTLTSAPPNTPPPSETSNSGRDALASASHRADGPPSGTQTTSLVLAIAAGGACWRGLRPLPAPIGQTDGDSCWHAEFELDAGDHAEPNRRALKSVEVQQGRSADAVVVATGYVESRRQARIGARAPGRIDSVTFEEGDRVTAGELLAELDHKDLDASFAASAASVARAKAALGEQEILINRLTPISSELRSCGDCSDLASRVRPIQLHASVGAGPAGEPESRFAVWLKHNNEQAEQLLENMFVRAPFNGTVISKDAEEGESIMPGGTGGTSGRGSVATIADLDTLDIVCDVQEGFISRVREAQEADIAIDAVPDKKYHGVVRKIIPMGDRARATIKVQVQINDTDELLFPEMSGTVFFLPTEKEVEVSEERRIFCPTAAVDFDPEGNASVWVVDPENLARRIEIKTGQDRDGRTEVLEGLTGKERVVMDPKDLQSGTPVRITE